MSTAFPKAKDIFRKDRVGEALRALQDKVGIDGSQDPTSLEYRVTAGPPGSGEANTASNVGSAGVGVFDAKSGVDLQFRKLNPLSARITITLDSGNKKIDLDVPLSAFEASGAVASHVAAGDPHTQYQRESEKDAASGYAGLNASSKLSGSQQTYGSGANTACQGDDSRLSDARTPTAHASSHQSGGGDAIKLDDLAAPDDNTDLNASTTKHGLCPKLSGNASDVFKGDGTFGSGGGGTWTTVKKTADESITNNTLQDDDHLFFTLSANTNYYIRLRVFFTTAATPDFKYRVVASGATISLVRRWCDRVTGAATARTAVAVQTAFDSADVAMAGSGNDGIVFEDIIVHVGGTGGTFKFQWAQNTTNATAAIVRAGSHLEHMTL